MSYPSGSPISIEDAYRQITARFEPAQYNLDLNSYVHCNPLPEQPGENLYQSCQTDLTITVDLVASLRAKGWDEFDPQA